MSIAFIKVVLKSLLRRWKEVTRVCLAAFLALFFVTSVLIVQENIYQWQMALNRQRFGDWFITDRAVTQSEMFANHPYLDHAAVAYSSVALYDESFEELGITAGFMTEDFMKRGHIVLAEGHLPENDHEIVMDWNTMLTLGFELELDQTVTLHYYKDNESYPEDNKLSEEYVICGILENYTNIWENSGWLPWILMTESRTAALNEQHENVYIYPLKTYIRTDNYRELYENICGGKRGYLYNASVYDYKPWGSEFVYHYLYVLVMLIGIAALTYQMLLYYKGRKETWDQFRRLGAVKGQVRFIKVFESLLIIVVFGILGIIGAIAATRIICSSLENAKGVSFYYVDNKLIAKAVLSIFIAFIVQEAVLGISGVAKKKRVKKVTVKEETKASKMLPENARSVIGRRLIKSNGVGLNIGVRLFALGIACVLFVCSVNIYTAYNAYVDNNNQPDLVGFRQEDFNGTFLIPAVVSRPYFYQSSGLFSTLGASELLTNHLEKDYTKEEYINSFEKITGVSSDNMFLRLSQSEDFVMKKLELFRMSRSVYYKDSNTFLAKGITDELTDTVYHMEGVKDIRFSAFETSRRWTWEGMDYKKLDVVHLYEYIAPDKGKNKTYGSRYVFATDYVEPSRELYERLEKYIDTEYINYDDFASGRQVILILKEHANKEYDDTIHAGDTIQYHYLDMPIIDDEYSRDSEFFNMDAAFVDGLPYYKACYRLKYDLMYRQCYSQSSLADYYTKNGREEDSFYYRYMAASLMGYEEKFVDFWKNICGRNYDYLYAAPAQPQVAAVIRYSDEFAEEFSDVLVDYGYYTAIASLNLADSLIDRQNEFMAQYYEVELPEEAKISLVYNQMAVTYDLTSTFSSTHNVLQALCNSNNFTYLSNNEEKVIYRENCLNTLLQYGITMLAAVVMNVCICAILLKNRLEQRKKQCKLFHQLGMTKAQIFRMNLFEIFRESLWCILTLPIQMIMGAVIIGLNIRRI